MLEARSESQVQQGEERLDQLTDMLGVRQAARHKWGDNSDQASHRLTNMARPVQRRADENK